MNHQESENDVYAVDLFIGMLFSLFTSLFHVAIAIGVITISNVLLRHYTSFTVFESTIVSIGVWGLVTLNAIHNKVNAMKLMNEWQLDSKPDNTDDDLFYEDDKVIAMERRQRRSPHQPQ